MKSRKKLKNELRAALQDAKHFENAYTEADKKLDQIQEIIGWRMKMRTYNPVYGVHVDDE